MTKDFQAYSEVPNRRGEGNLISGWGGIIQKCTTQLDVLNKRGVIDDVYCSDLVLCCI